MCLLGYSWNSHNEKDALGAGSMAGNPLYYISIGNGHYQMDANDYWTGLPEASTSADQMGKFLSCYGPGTVLKSAENKVLSRAMLINSLTLAIDRGVKDSLSTTFIYYCGHGFCDKKGNVYLAPGSSHIGSEPGDFITIKEIQDKIVSAMRAVYPLDSITGNDPEVQRLAKLVQRPQVPGGDTARDKIFQQMYAIRQKNMAGWRRPRFVILADCCTNDADKVDYRVFFNKDISREFDVELQRMDAQGLDPAIKQMMLNKLNPAIYNMSVPPTKATMWLYGNKTIYTAEQGKVAKMIPSPLNKNEMVGPICGRLAVFFGKDRHSFDIAQLMRHLSDHRLDNISPAPRYESGNNGMQLDMHAMEHYYETKIGEDVDIKKGDSVIYLCH